MPFIIFPNRPPQLISVPRTRPLCEGQELLICTKRFQTHPFLQSNEKSQNIPKKANLIQALTSQVASHRSSLLLFAIQAYIWLFTWGLLIFNCERSWYVKAMQPFTHRSILEGKNKAKSKGQRGGARLERPVVGCRGIRFPYFGSVSYFQCFLCTKDKCSGFFFHSRLSDVAFMWVLEEPVGCSFPRAHLSFGFSSPSVFFYFLICTLATWTSPQLGFGVQSRHRAPFPS